MNVKLKVLRKVLEEAIANIDAGNSNHSDDELDDIISSLTKLNRGIKRISKREACERILHCSPSSFDNYIKLGLIPRGHNGKVCKGEIYNYDCAKNVFDKYVRNINSSITVWDVYVAINAQYHDYVRLYSEWFRNINKNELDNKIIESAITFYFKDEDSGSTKTWNYFKTAN